MLVGSAWLIWSRRRREAAPLEQLAQQAEEAIKAIQSGADLRDTVLRCYHEMIRVLHQQRGIERHQAMTPREFASSLEKVGLPSQDIEKLTDLFERVRYGTRIPDQKDEAQAMACLASVVDFCRRAQ
jgi:hypothetical protein